MSQKTKQLSLMGFIRNGSKYLKIVKNKMKYVRIALKKFNSVVRYYPKNTGTR